MGECFNKSVVFVSPQEGNSVQVIESVQLDYVMVEFCALWVFSSAMINVEL